MTMSTTKAPWNNGPSKLRVRQEMQAMAILHGKTTEPIEKAPERKKRGNEEHQFQAAFVKWCDMQSGDLAPARKIFAIPNGGSRHMLEAVHLKQEGVRAGIPDLMLPVPIPPYHGLFIEMKSSTGSETKDQRERIEALRQDGYAAVVCKSTDEAIRRITEYLRGRLS
jgi:hypothetical protein